MKIKGKMFLSILTIIILNSMPIYAAGYEDANLGGIILKLIFYLFVFVLVIAITIYGTKLISKSFKGISSSKYIQLLDAINLPGGSKLVIAKIDKKIYILGTNNSTTTTIDIIKEEDFSVENFDNYLSKYLNARNTHNNTLENLFNRINKKKDRDGNNEEKKY